MTFVRTMAQAAVSGALPIKASPTDTTPDNLLPKLAAGAGVSLALLNPGANEQVEITAAGGGLVYSATVITGTGNVNAVVGEIARWDGINSRTLFLPAAPSNNDQVGLQLVSNAQSGGDITIDGNGKDVFAIGIPSISQNSWQLTPVVLRFDAGLNVWFAAVIDAAFNYIAGTQHVLLGTDSSGTPVAIPVGSNDVVGRTGSGNIGTITIQSIVDLAVAGASGGLPYGPTVFTGSGTFVAVISEVNRYVSNGFTHFTMPTSGAGNDGKRIAFMEGAPFGSFGLSVVATADGSDKFAVSNSNTLVSSVNFAKKRGYVEYKYQWQGSSGFGIWEEITSTMTARDMPFSATVIAGSGTFPLVPGVINRYNALNPTTLTLPAGAQYDGQFIGIGEASGLDVQTTLAASGSDFIYGSWQQGPLTSTVVRRPGGALVLRYSWLGSFGVWGEAYSSFNQQDYARLFERTAAPGTVLNTGSTYTKDVGSITELFYQDSNGVETQITSNGTVL